MEVTRIATEPFDGFEKRFAKAAGDGDYDLVFFSQVFFDSGFRVRDFGPLRVAMDSHGGSIYAAVDADARGNRAAALAALGVKAR